MATTQKGTYYPSDYSKIADVPADMKKMAESIDKQTDNLVQKEEGKGLSSNDFTNELKTKLNNLENYDDTEVKQDISNLDTNKASKAELQEATIALQAELKATRKDLEASSLEGQDTGESLYLQDSSNARFREFGITGNSKQEKRDGYNYIDTSKLVTTENSGITATYLANGKIRLNGTSTAMANLYIRNLNKQLKAGTYTAKTNLTSTELNGVIFRDSDNASIISGVTNKKTATIEQDTVLDYILIQIRSGVTLNNFDFEIMLYEGTENKEWEQYGAMPSLEFPSEIRAVGQDVNLLNLSAFEDTTVNGVEIKRNSADEFDLKGTATGNITIDIPFNAVNLKGDYTLSTNKAGNITSTDIASTQFLIYDTSGNRITFNSRITQNKLTEDKCTITETVAINKARIYIANGTVLDCKLSFKLQKGNKATGYSQHNQGSCNVTVCNRNRFVPTLYANGAEINKARANVTLDGDTFVFECTGIDMYLGNIAGTGGRYSGSCGKLINVKTLNSISIKLTNKLFKKNFLTCFGKDLISLGIKQFMSDNLNNYTLPTGTEYVTLRFGIESPTVGTIYKTQVQIEEGNATDYTAHEEQTFTMPVQQEMLKEDYLDLDNEEEVHTWRKLVLDGTVNKITGKHNTIFTETNGFYPLVLEGKDNTHENGNSELAHCNYLKVTNEGAASLAVKENCVWWEGKYRTLYLSLPFLSITEANNFLKEKYDAGIPVTIYYKLAEPTKLTFTEAQKAVAKRIREKLHSYKGGTHVYSVDEISAIFNVRHTKDLNAVINNLSQQAIEGGN